MLSFLLHPKIHYNSQEKEQAHQENQASSSGVPECKKRISPNENSRSYLIIKSMIPRRIAKCNEKINVNI